MVTGHGTRWLRWSERRTTGQSVMRTWPLWGTNAWEQSRAETKTGIFSVWSHATQCHWTSLPNSNGLPTSESFQSTHCLTSTTQNSLAGIRSPLRSGKKTHPCSPAAPPASFTPLWPRERCIFIPAPSSPPADVLLMLFPKWNILFPRPIRLNPAFIHSHIEPPLCQVHLKCHLAKENNSTTTSVRKSHVILQFPSCCLKAYSTSDVLLPWSSFGYLLGW